MKIAVNTRLLLKNKLEGIGWFTFETLKRITRNNPETEFVFFFDRHFDEEFIFSSNIEPVILSPQARHPLLYYWWFEHTIPKALKAHNPALFLSPDGYLSLSSNIPSVQVIHDLNFEHFPRFLPYAERKYYRHFFPKYAKKAKRIATVSNYSKQDIAKCYNIEPGKIDVIYNGVNENYGALSRIEQEKVKMKYSDGASYFLFIGSLHPRKNVGNLLKAFDRFKTEDKQNTKLLIVGEQMWSGTNIRDTYSGMENQNDVVFTGRMEPKELNKVMASALALTYVSFFEGFGIPILEAMQSDVPVITSNTSSMPEVAGEAAILVDPDSLDSISGAMTKIATDTGLREKLIQKGRIQREQFSWDKTAAKLWECMMKAV